ncbi:MAG: helix-turn-helix transcriptional regulator [Muribaculaceae bacterium]|nr:helix-turn-helix transcriptional regulator [Muribaculaceae bacterium]
MTVLILAEVCHASRHNPAVPPLYARYKDLPIEEQNIRGIEYFLQQKNDSATMFLTLVVQRDTADLTPYHRLIMAKARNLLGIISFNHSNYPDAYRHFLKSIQLNDIPDAPGYLSLASVFLHYGDKARAFDYLKNYTLYACKNHHFNEACLGISNILSNNFIQAGISPDTIAFVVNRFLCLPDSAAKAAAFPLAYHLSKSWEDAHAGKHINSAEEIKATIRELNQSIMPRTRHALLLIVADQYMLAGLKDSAIYYIDAAEKLAIENDYKDLLSKTYSDASQIYLSFGDEMRSKACRQKMLEINDSLFNPKELGKIHDLNMFYEADKFERKIEIMTVRERMQRTVLWTIGCALVIVVFLLFVLFRKNHELTAKNKALFERNLSEMKEDDGSQETISSLDFRTGATNEALPDEKEIKQGENGADNVGTQKYAGSNITDETRKRVKEAIEKVFKDESIFCKEGFSLNDLAQVCKSNSRYVSQVINEDLHTTFTALINTERVKVARKRLMDTKRYGHLTIEAILSDLGCKSRSTFSKTFKKITGLTPSEFQRIAKERDSENSSEVANKG